MKYSTSARIQSACIVLLLSGCGPGPTRSTEKSKDTIVAEQSSSPKQAEDNSEPTAGLSPSPQSEPTETPNAAGPSTPTLVTLPNENPKPPSVAPTDAQLAKWNLQSVDPLKLLAFRDLEKIGLVSTMAKTPDGNFYLLGGTKVTLWALKGTSPEHSFKDLGTADKPRTILSMAISSDGKWFATGDSEGQLTTWSLENRTQLVSKKIYSNGVTQIAISPDGQEIATINYTSDIAIWNKDKLEPKKGFKVDAPGLKKIMYVATDLLATAGETTSIWKVSSGTLESSLSPSRYHFSLATSNDNKRFAYGDKQGIQFLNTASLKVESSILGSFATNEWIEFSPDGKHLASASGFMIRIWDIERNRVVQVIDSYGWAIVGMIWMKESNALLVANEIGQIRVWGNTDTSTRLDLKPIHDEVTMPEATARVPAYPMQVLAAIDLRTFPKLPGAVVSVAKSDALTYEAAGTSNEAILFCTHCLGLKGWSQQPIDRMTPAQVHYQKSGFAVSASFYEADSKTSISLVNSGDFDLRWAPKTDVAPIVSVYESDLTLMYQTKAILLDIELDLLKKMTDAGWTAYSRLHASQTEPTDSRMLSFLQNSTVVNISISNLPADPSQTMIQYSKSLTPNSIPIPKDSGLVEFDGSTQPYLVATTSMGLAEARNYYDEQMAAQGWLAVDRGRVQKEEVNWLPYFRGQQDLTIGLESRPMGRTLIRVGKDLEKSSWQLAKPKPRNEPKETVGIEAAEFPILNAGKVAIFDEGAKSLEFEMGKSKLSEVAEQYSKQFAKLGWTTDGRGINADDYTFLTFRKEKIEIDLRARIKEGNAVVSIQGEGLLWSKPLPGSDKVISFESWLRKNSYPAGLGLIAAYEKEMRQIMSK